MSYPGSPPPPPYVNITGISRTVMKDNAQETLSNYNGNARPGEIVADLTQDPPTLYVGNNLGQLTLIASGGNGGNYGNADVASYLNTGLSGNIIPASNSVYSLGNATNYWSNLWVAGNTLYIGGVPVGVSGNSLTVNGNVLLSANTNSNIDTTGNITASYFIGNGSLLTGIAGGSYNDSNVSSLLAAFGTNTIVTTGNVTVGNLITANGANVILGGVNSRIRQNSSNATINLAGSITLTPDISSSPTNGVIIGGLGYLLAADSSRNAVLNYGGVSGQIGFNNINLYGATATAITNGAGNVVGNIGANNNNRFNTIFLSRVDASNTIVANSYIRGRNYIVVDSDQPTEGGQLVLSYCNTTGMTGQANSTWNIDVDSLNSFRIFNQNGAGNITDVIYLSGANSNMTLSNNLLVPNGNISTSYLIATGVKTTATVVSSLPNAANAGAGTRAFVTDADANTFGANVAGGGANSVPVFSNGTLWLIG